MEKKCSGVHSIRLAGVANLGSKGQIVIPKDIRDLLGVQPGDSVTLIVKDEKMLGLVPNNSVKELMEYVESEENVTLIK